VNQYKRNRNRGLARGLAAIARFKELKQHTCENCGEKGGHWVSTRGLSIAVILTGQDDQEGFWTCPKLYGEDGRRIVD